MPKKDQASYIAAYNKSKLVNLIYEQTMIPVWVLNQDAIQKAINTNVEIATTGKSEMARVTAANSLLTHLKPPETTKLEIGMSGEAKSAMDGLRKATEDLVAAQRAGLKSGTVSAKDIAEQPLVVDGEYETVE